MHFWSGFLKVEREYIQFNQFFSWITLGTLGLKEKSENDFFISQMDLNLLLHSDKFY